jgi:hypothetical protein
VSFAEKFVQIEVGSRIWYEKIRTDLVAAGFETSRACPCVFEIKEKQVYLLVYVDDILVIGKNNSDITETKQILSKLYELKDMGIARYFWASVCTGTREHKFESTVVYHTYV